MSTINQRVVLKNYKHPIIYKRAKLKKAPQRKATVIRLRICTPRKPNSARRPVVKALLTTKLRVLAHIPGSGHTLKKHSRVLVAGVGARDLPVVNYSCLRGVYDFEPLYLKKKRRSIYGAGQKTELKTFVRRKFRKLMNGYIWYNY